MSAGLIRCFIDQQMRRASFRRKFVSVGGVEVSYLERGDKKCPCAEGKAEAAEGRSGNRGSRRGFGSGKRSRGSRSGGSRSFGSISRSNSSSVQRKERNRNAVEINNNKSVSWTKEDEEDDDEASPSSSPSSLSSTLPSQNQDGASLQNSAPERIVDAAASGDAFRADSTSASAASVNRSSAARAAASAPSAAYSAPAFNRSACVDVNVVTSSLPSTVMLLIHGFAADGRCWAPLVRHFESSVHAVAIDLPGFGESTENEAVLSTEALPRFIRDFVFSVSLNLHPGGIHVVGHSMGGAVAAAFVALHGADSGVTRLTLISPAMTTPRPSPFMKAAERGEFERWLTPSRPADLKKTLDHVVCRRKLKVMLRLPGVVGGLHKVFLTEEKRRVGRLIWRRLKSFFWDSERFYIAYGAETKVPTTLVWGREDGIIDVSGVEVLVRCYDAPEVVVLEKCSHAIFLERGPKVARILRRVAGKGGGEDVVV